MTAPREDPGVVDLGAAARRVLEDDGRTFVLQPWQVAYCVALSEGRPAVVPPGCGVGKGWLDARLRAAGRATDRTKPEPDLGDGPLETGG